MIIVQCAHLHFFIEMSVYLGATHYDDSVRSPTEYAPTFVIGANRSNDQNVNGQLHYSSANH
jgi:hypothetical protein